MSAPVRMTPVNTITSVPSTLEPALNFLAGLGVGLIVAAAVAIRAQSLLIQQRAFASSEVLGALPAPSVQVKPIALYRIDPPPNEYIGGAKLLVYFADPATVAMRCLRANQLACAHPDEKTLTLTDPCFFPDDEYASLICHEKAHTLGYAHPTPWRGTEADIANEKMAQDISRRARKARSADPGTPAVRPDQTGSE